MIYTITLNPSIDFVVRVEDLLLGETNRAYTDEMYAGGKGIMVSKLLKNIGSESIATGFMGGFTGTFILENLEALGLKTAFVKIKDRSRINLKLKAHEETEINSKGPKISDEEEKEFLEKIRAVKEDDFVILSGSIPAGLDANFYNHLMDILNEKKVMFSLDTGGNSLRDAIAYKPFFIKPNKAELEEYAAKKFNDNSEIIDYVRKNLSDKIQHIVVSLGGDGALYISKDFALFAPVVNGTVVNTVGAGDSLVAGFIDRITKGATIEEAFCFGVACGTATAFSEDIGSLELIEKIQKEIKIERIDYEH